MTTKQELINRWDNFLAQIRNRFDESLQQANEASHELLEESNYDYNQTIQAFAGIKGQIQNLIQKIDTTWDEKVRPQMKDTFEDTSWVDESIKGSELSEKLWRELHVFELILEGTLSERYYNHAIQIADANFHCSQCKAKLEINKRIFRSQYITCDYCDTVNTFEPETKYTQIGWGIVNNIITLKLLENKRALAETYNNIKNKTQFNQATKQDWEDYKIQYLAYHELYFKERIKLNADYEKRFEDDMQRKLKELKESEPLNNIN